MGLGIGIVGLPNVGKSTLFNAITRAGALAANYPFATIEPNVGRVMVPDARLNALSTVTSLTDPAITSTYNMGRSSTASYQAEYSDVASDPNAAHGGALSSSFPGLSTDVDRDGKIDFRRYWNVYAVDPTSSGTPSGKLVQVIVRWKEPNYGYRQVSSTAFKVNPNAALQ